MSTVTLDGALGENAVGDGAPRPGQDPIAWHQQSLHRAKAHHLTRQLQTRLRYARLKVEHGWQRQTLTEVENLYFNQTKGRRSTKAAARRANSHSVNGRSQPNGAEASSSHSTSPRAPSLDSVASGTFATSNGTNGILQNTDGAEGNIGPAPTPGTGRNVYGGLQTPFELGGDGPNHESYFGSLPPGLSSYVFDPEALPPPIPTVSTSVTTTPLVAPHPVHALAAPRLSASLPPAEAPSRAASVSSLSSTNAGLVGSANITSYVAASRMNPTSRASPLTLASSLLPANSSTPHSFGSTTPQGSFISTSQGSFTSASPGAFIPTSDGASASNTGNLTYDSFWSSLSHSARTPAAQSGMQRLPPASSELLAHLTAMQTPATAEPPVLAQPFNAASRSSS